MPISPIRLIGIFKIKSGGEAKGWGVLLKGASGEAQKEEETKDAEETAHPFRRMP